MKKTSFIAALLLLAGCTVGPDYHPQIAPVPRSFTELPTNQDQAPISAPVSDQGDLSRWWLQFGDTELQSLISRSLQSNLDLLAAASRVREAREQEIIAGAQGLPQIGAGGVLTGIHGASRISPAVGNGFYSAGFDATWEIDVFGGDRRRVEASEASSEAALWRMRDGVVALTAEVATDYLALRATQGRIDVLRAEVKTQQDLLQVAKARAGAGFVTQLDINRQTALVNSTDAQLPQLEGDVRAFEHALAVLLAEQPGALSAELDRSAALPRAPATLPIGLPSDLLRRRPDVRAAERDLGAATARVGVAVSNLYPKFNLIGAVGLAGGSLAAGGNAGELGLGAITWPIFHWDQDHAIVRAEEEEAKQSYYAYQKSVLGAVQDVENALSRYTSEQRRLVVLERAETAAQSSIAIASQQFRVGTVTYVDVLVAEASELALRNQLEQSQQFFAIDLVSLYKALGGGWAADPRDSERDNSAEAGDILATRLVSAASYATADHSSDPMSTSDVPLADSLTSKVMGRQLPGAIAKARSDVLPSPVQSNAGSTRVDKGSLSARSLSDESKVGVDLQLGAWRSEAAAIEGWSRASRVAADLLNGLQPHIRAADLPGKGRYYRLRVSPDSSLNSAKFCEALRAKGLACMPVQERAQPE